MLDANPCKSFHESRSHNHLSVAVFHNESPPYTGKSLIYTLPSKLNKRTDELLEWAKKTSRKVFEICTRKNHLWIEFGELELSNIIANCWDINLDNYQYYFAEHHHCISICIMSN